MALKDILNQRLQNLESNPLSFVNGIQANAIEQLNNMIGLLSQLDVDAQGRILNTAQNLRKIDTIIQGIGDLYYDDQYIDQLRGFASSFSDQLALNKKYLNTLGKFTDDELFSLTMKAAQKQAVSALSKTAVDAYLLEPISSMLVNSVSTESKFSDAVNFLKSAIGANPEIDSRWTRHAKQIAFDSFAITDRQTSVLMARQNGYEYYNYYGTIKDTTRCFCRVRVGNVYHISEYEKWGDRQGLGGCKVTLKGGESGWAGMNENTNAENILSFMGGWNCRHIPQPVPRVDTVTE